MRIKKILFVPLFALLLSGCNPPVTSEEPSSSLPPTSEVIEAESIIITSQDNKTEIIVGQTLAMSAKVLPEGAPQEIIWESSDPTKASVNEAGLVTAKAIGNVFIIAKAKAKEAVRKQFGLTIKEEETPVVEPESIMISAPNGVTSLEVSKTLLLSSYVLPVEADQKVVWSTNDESIATIAENGLVTAISEGNVTLKATSSVKESIFATYALQIVAASVPDPTQEWEKMEYSNHEDFMALDTPADTPFKVKGIITHLGSEVESKASYYIQDGNDGYFIYNQDVSLFPVTLGKSYDVGGFFKNYNGTRQLVNVEYFVERNDTLTYNVTNISDKDVTDLNLMAPYHASFVDIDVALLSSLPSNYSKAYTVKVKVNDKEFDLRVDPTLTGAEEFVAITEVVQNLPIGSALSVKGVMSAFGYGTPKNQVQVLKAEHLVPATLSDQEIVDVAITSIEMLETVDLTKTSVSLPSSLEGYEGLTLDWESNNPIIDATTGKVTHPLMTSDVTLTVTATKGEASATRTFILTVFGTDETKLETLHTLDLEDAGPAGEYGTSAMKPSYNVTATNNMVDSGTPVTKWQLNNTLIGGDGNEKKNGEFAMRSQSNNDEAKTGRIELQDNTYEFNMIEFKAAIYGANRKGMVLMFEVSVDNGETWTPVEREYTINHFELETYRLHLGIARTMRVAIIMKAGTGQRVNIDDLKLIKEST